MLKIIINFRKIKQASAYNKDSGKKRKNPISTLSAYSNFFRRRCDSFHTQGTFSQVSSKSALEIKAHKITQMMTSSFGVVSFDNAVEIRYLGMH